MRRIAVAVGASNIIGLPNRELAAVIGHLAADVSSALSNGVEVVLIATGGPLFGEHVRSSLTVPSSSPVGPVAHSGDRSLSALGQSEVICAWAAALRGWNVPCVSISVTHQDLADHIRFEHLKKVVSDIASWPGVPMFTENVVMAAESSLGDNDQLVCTLATALQADMLVYLVPDEGLFAATEGFEKHMVGTVESADDLEASVRIVPTQTLLDPSSKLEAARLVTTFGLEMVVASSLLNGVIGRVIAGDQRVGTRFLARGARLRQRKSWLALASQSRGEIVVSSFLAETLRARRPASILLIGIERFAGTFEKNDVVTVRALDGKTLGRGEVRMSSSELRERISRRQEGREAFFGTEVIHCDYFVHAPV